MKNKERWNLYQKHREGGRNIGYKEHRFNDQFNGPTRRYNYYKDKNNDLRKVCLETIKLELKTKQIKQK